MKLAATLLPAFLTFGVLAEPLPKASGKRALQDFVDVISDIDDQVLVVKDMFNDYTGGDGTDLIDASQKIVDLINSGVETVDDQSMLTVSEALDLVVPIQGLRDDVNDTIDVTIDKKSVVDENDYHDEVLDNLNDQKTASEALADAITAKVPEEVQDTAKELADQIAAGIQRGIDAYSD